MSRLISDIAKHTECPFRWTKFLVIHRSWTPGSLWTWSTEAIDFHCHKGDKMYKPKQKYLWLPSENSNTTRCGVSWQRWHGLGWTDVSRLSDDMEQYSCPVATIQLAGEGRGRGLPTAHLPACLLHLVCQHWPCRKTPNKQQKI